MTATIGLGADIICGFPGETDADHRATLALVDALPFTYLHVFPFSARPDTAAVLTREGELAPRVWLIAAGRVVLAVSSLFAVWLDPAEPAKFADVAYSLLAAYVAYAAAIALLVWRSDAPSHRQALVTHAFDLVFFSLFIYSFFIFGPLQELGNVINTYRETEASMANFEAV